MLNELHDLAKSLKAAQVSMSSWHNYFTSCPKGPATYYLFVDPLGQVTDLEPIRDRERIVSIRKWDIPGQGTSFPAFNVLPLFEPKTETDKKAAGDLRKVIVSKSPPSRDEIKQRLEAIHAASNSLWMKKEPLRITKCLTLIPNDVAKMLGTAPKEFSSITDLIARVSKLTVKSLHARLVTIVIGKIVETPSAAADWFDVLFFHSGKKATKLSLIAELSDRSAFAYPANHERVQGWMNSRFQEDKLPDDNEGGQSIAADYTDDVFAMPAIGLDETFPSVRFQSAIGDVKLRAMSSEHPCQRRYGFADSQSCRVGQVSRDEMKTALEWIGDADRRGKTWSDVSSLTGKKGVLFAYPSQLVESELAGLAGLIVGLDDRVDRDGAKFEQCARRVTTSLTELVRKQPHEAPTTEIRVFVLTKPDGFRTKVLSSGRYSVERLLMSANEWMACCRNVPSIWIRQCGEKKGDKPCWVEPFIPYPAEVVICLNTAWERAGTHAQPVPGFGIGDGLGLLLEDGVVLKAIATRAIRTLVPNSLSLVLALGFLRSQDIKELIKKRHPALAHKQSRLLPSIFGLLLAKLGRLKGKYMKGPPFLVGRLLSLADQLHVEYCLDERKGQIPTQLFGSALMSTALEQPEKALALLCQRIPPYKNWATRLQTGERVGLTKFLLGEMGRLCNQLKECGVPKTADDADKAEMLLGYLATTEKAKDPNNSTQPTVEGAST